MGARALLTLVVPLSLGMATGDPGQPSAYIGGSVCKTCHPDVWLNFYKNPHYKSLARAKTPPPGAGCESCHGPARAHVEGQGDKSAIRAFSRLTPKETLQACLACHSKDFSRWQIRRSWHTEAEIACTSCHSIHRSATPKHLLARKQADLCYGCHAPVRAQFSMPFKHRVNEGFMACTDCHNPHGASAPTWRMGARPRMVEQALVNEEACLKCHSDKRGPFVFEHPSVRVEGCETCHQPHGSTNARLLRRPVVMAVCLECHNGAGNFGRQGDGIAMLSPTHNLAEPRYQRCTTCHFRIHGSNTDQLFLR